MSEFVINDQFSWFVSIFDGIRKFRSSTRKFFFFISQRFSYIVVIELVKHLFVDSWNVTGELFYIEIHLNRLVYSCVWLFAFTGIKDDVRLLNKRSALRTVFGARILAGERMREAILNNEMWSFLTFLIIEILLCFYL